MYQMIQLIRVRSQYGGAPRLWGPRNWSKKQRELDGGRDGWGHRVGKQASGMEPAKRKCLIPVSAVASDDPPYVCLVMSRTHKTAKFFSS